MDTTSAKLPSIPEYFKTYVDRNVDLEQTHSIPCPFHGEKHGKSFSYSSTLGKWRCWGACHTGGDVIDLHRLNYHLKTREEAQVSLYNILGITLETKVSFEREVHTPDAMEVYRRRLYAAALSVAKEPQAWDELDYILSKAPFDTKELEVFCAAHGYAISQTQIMEDE